MLLVLISILLVIILLLMWLVFAPLIIKIDTERHEYFIALKGLIKIWPEWNLDGLQIHTQLPAYHFIKRLSFRKEEGTKPVKKESRTRYMPFKKMMAVLRTFKVRYMDLTIDTDDYTLNALLVPIFQLINRPNFRGSVNFQGETRCELEIRNNLWRIAIAYWIRK